MEAVPYLQSACVGAFKAEPEAPAEPSWMPALQQYDVASYPGVKGAFALTFDVAVPPVTSEAAERTGDDRPSTLGRVLRVLQEQRLQATFFVPLDAVLRKSSCVWEILQDGHEVACRGWKPDDQPIQQFEDGILSAARLLHEVQNPQPLTAKAGGLDHLHDELGLQLPMQNSAGSPGSTTASASSPSSARGLLQSPEEMAVPRWFRVVPGKGSAALRQVLNRLGLTNVQGNCYIYESWTTQDIMYRLQSLASVVESGSIVALPVPDLQDEALSSKFAEVLQSSLAAAKLKAWKGLSLKELHCRANVEQLCNRPKQAGPPIEKLRPADTEENSLMAGFAPPVRSSSDLMDTSPRQGWAKLWPAPLLAKVAPVKMSFHKMCVKAASSVPRPWLEFAFPGSLCYFDEVEYRGLCAGEQGMIALTLDDAPCSPNGEPMLDEIQKVLDEFGAKATFFLTTDYVAGHEETLRDLVRAGHEVANHCEADRPYTKDSKLDFEAALLRSERICDELRGQRRPRTRFFRAPWARMNPEMWEVLNLHGFTHVLTDCYANDPWIDDADFLAKSMLKRASVGSVAVLHTPERGFREYNLEALRLFLQGLQDIKPKPLRAVTLTELYEAAYGATKLRSR
mmetsp:Transcript_17364/g.40497  ORF Transcript_17364/g.40497 Transcript_17364/m.40497 type:complete len:625 (-) Transcript_17364:128-2002(-)